MYSAAAFAFPSSEFHLQINVNPVQRIELKVDEVSRDKILGAISKKIPLKWTQNAPGLSEPVSLNFNGLNIVEALENILSPFSYVLIQKETKEGAVWEIDLLGQGLGAQEFPLVKPEVLEAFKRWARGALSEKNSGYLMEELLFSGDEKEVFQLLKKAASAKDLNARLKANEFLEEFEEDWQASL